MELVFMIFGVLIFPILANTVFAVLILSGNSSGLKKKLLKNGVNVIEGIVSAFHNFPWSPYLNKDICERVLLSHNLALT